MKPMYIALIAAVTAVMSFFGGMKYQQNRQPKFQGLVPGQNMVQFRGQNGSGGNFERQGMQPVNGEIIKKDDNTITLKLEDGSSKIVIIGDKTRISKAEELGKEVLKEGEKVVAFGNTNSDGSITAINIQLNPVSVMFQRNNP